MAIVPGEFAFPTVVGSVTPGRHDGTENPVKGPENSTSRALPRVSVIIPVKNDSGGLQLLLGSLAHQEYPQDKLEVIVVHNDYRALDGVDIPGVDTVSLAEPAGASYAARNAGIARATGEVLAFTDADCIAHPRWVVEGVKALGRRPRSLVAGTITVFASSKSPNLIERHQLRYAFDQQLNVVARRGLATANLFSPREAFEKVGNFNSSMVSGGDADWSLRALESDYRWAFSTEAIIYHPARHTISQVFGQRLRFARAIPAQESLRQRIRWLVKWLAPSQAWTGPNRRNPDSATPAALDVRLLYLCLSIFQTVAGLVFLFAPQPRQPEGKGAIAMIARPSRAGPTALQPMDRGRRAS